MAIAINDNYSVNAPKFIDARWSKNIGGTPYAVPYASIAECQDATAYPRNQSAFRFIGLMHLILKSGVPTIYWYRDGIANGDLVEFAPNGYVTKTVLNKTQADLVFDSDSGTYYLPIDLTGKDYLIASVVTDFGGGITITEYISADRLFNKSDWAFPRLTGFANNAAQTITVKLI